MTSKRFDRELYNQNDELCRNKVKELLKDTHYKIVDNPKKMGVDLLVFENDKHILNIETERKKVWSGNKFPYENVNFPERKKKYAVLDKPTLFLMFNEDLTNYLVVTSVNFLNSPTEEVHNKYVRAGEQFYKIDLTKVKFNNIQDSIKEIVNE